MPVKERGAYVVVAGDDDLTCTTLFLISDVECVVKKAGGRQLLVWAFDRKTHAPVAGARVLAAGEGEVGRTGTDGVWIGTKARRAARRATCWCSPTRGPPRPRSSPGQSAEQGFRSKAYVYTDRPVYRPGAKVQWRAIYLDADGGAYRRPSKRQGTSRIYDPRGQEVAQRARVTSTAFGTFSGAFAVDAAAPARDVAHPGRAWTSTGSWDGTFEVQEFRKPEFTVTVTPAQARLPDGRDRAGRRCELRYAFGGAVAERAAALRGLALPAHLRGPPRPRTTPGTSRTSVPRRRSAPSDGGASACRRWRRSAPTRTGAPRSPSRRRSWTRTPSTSCARAPRTSRGAGSWTRTASPSRAATTWPSSRRTARSTGRSRRCCVEVRTVDARERPVARTGVLQLMRLKRTTRPLDVKRRGGEGRPPYPVAVTVREEEVELRQFPADARTTPGGPSCASRSSSPDATACAGASTRAAASWSRPTPTSRPAARRRTSARTRASWPRARSTTRASRPRCCSTAPSAAGKRAAHLRGRAGAGLPLRGPRQRTARCSTCRWRGDTRRTSSSRWPFPGARSCSRPRPRSSCCGTSTSPSTIEPGDGAARLRGGGRRSRRATRTASPCAPRWAWRSWTRPSTPWRRTPRRRSGPYFYDRRRTNAVVSASSARDALLRHDARDEQGPAGRRGGAHGRRASASHAQSALRLAREALRRGDIEVAREAGAAGAARPIPAPGTRARS